MITEPVTLRARRADRVTYLIVGDAGSEIRREQVHLDGPRDLFPGGTGETACVAERDAACVAAEAAGQRAMKAAAGLVDHALAAALVGDHDRAVWLRAGAIRASGAANAVEAALRVLTQAIAVANRAAENAVLLLMFGARADGGDVEPAAG